MAFNHQTFPALGALFAGLYFSKSYDVPEGKRWLETADSLFRAQSAYAKVHEDCNTYQWLTCGHIFSYAMARPDSSIFENGVGKKMIDYCLGTMDNLGIQVPYGDTGTWRGATAEIPCLDMFAYATKDPAARWAANLKRTERSAFSLYSFAQPEAAPRPTAYDGVQTWPLEPAYVRTFPEEGRPSDAFLFDKISFRERLDPASPYLLLDGLNNGSHGHLDGNSLERLTQYDRIWLADNDYFKKQVKYHNSILVFKDGEATAIPAYAARLGAGETPRYGYSYTRLAGYTHVTWDRYVVWLKRLQAFVIVDKLTAEAPGEYQFRLLWHGVGDAALSESGMLLKQKGPSMWIQIASGPQLRLVDDPALGENWKGYDFADPVVRSLSATAKVKLDANESYVYATVLHGHADGEAAPWKIERLKDADGFRLNTGSDVLAVLLQTPPDMASGAQVSVIDSAGISLLGAAPAPTAAAISRDVQDGSLLERVSRWPVSPSPRNLAPAAAAPSPTTVWDRRPTQQKSAGGASAFRFTHVVAAHLDAGKLPALLATTREGTLLALSGEGETLWSREFGAPLNDIAVADLTGDARDEIVLARQDHFVTVLDAAGNELWSRGLQYYRRPPYVNIVRTGDIDGDGRLEVIAGGENWRFYAFTAGGKELWNYESVHPSRSGAVADLDGDGKAEVLCGTHYYNASVLNADGTLEWSYRLGPICYDIATGSFEAGKTRGVIFGGGDGILHYTDYRGQSRMKFNTGEEVRVVAAADMDGDGRDEILGGSMNSYIYCFDGEAKPRWRHDLGDGVTTLVTVPDAKGAVAVAGTEAGNLFSFDAAGRLLTAARLGSPIVCATGYRGDVVVATEDGWLRRLHVKP